MFVKTVTPGLLKGFASNAIFLIARCAPIMEHVHFVCLGTTLVLTDNARCVVSTIAALGGSMPLMLSTVPVVTAICLGVMSVRMVILSIPLVCALNVMSLAVLNVEKTDSVLVVMLVTTSVLMEPVKNVVAEVVVLVEEDNQMLLTALFAVRIIAGVVNAKMNIPLRITAILRVSNVVELAV